MPVRRKARGEVRENAMGKPVNEIRDANEFLGERQRTKTTTRKKETLQYRVGGGVAHHLFSHSNKQQKIPNKKFATAVFCEKVDACLCGECCVQKNLFWRTFSSAVGSKI